MSRGKEKGIAELIRNVEVRAHYLFISLTGLTLSLLENR